MSSTLLLLERKSSLWFYSNQLFPVSQDPLALRGGLGEKSLRQIIEHGNTVADRALPADQTTIRKLCSEITTMTDALCELRQDGKGATPQVGESVTSEVKCTLIVLMPDICDFSFVLSLKHKRKVPNI